jgi:hypothetical protein
MSRRSGIRFADKDMRQPWNLQHFPFIWDHSVIPYERETLKMDGKLVTFRTRSQVRSPSRTDHVRYCSTGRPLIKESTRPYGDQGGLTTKLMSSGQSTEVSQGFVPPSPAIKTLPSKWRMYFVG